MHKYITLLLTLLSLHGYSQAPFTAIGTPYTQNFNTLPNTTDGGTPTGGWTDNVTLTGWYSSVAPLVESSLGGMNNTGANYIVASGTDRSFGSRASGGTGTCYYGVRLVNNTGSAISSVYVQYYGEQWSIAENGANVNSISFAYRTGTGLTSLTAGGWTNVTALNFNQIFTSSQSAGMGGTACGGSSGQCLSLNGNAAANRVLIGACVPVALSPGSEIMLRWSDINDAANDHHLQIDDLSVYPYAVSCATVLPVEWLSFTAEPAGAASLLQWETASEENNDYFAVERLDENGSYITIGTVDGNGSTSFMHRYSFTDENPLTGINYYRIRQVDFNGQSAYSVLRSVTFGEEESFAAYAYFDGELRFHQRGNRGATQISVIAEDGRVLSSLCTDESSGVLGTPACSGIYFVRFENVNGVAVVKQLILL
jgi:hypothetical protein